MLVMPKFSLGHGDRFAHQGAAQLAAVLKARAAGVDLAPVWNKSHREHTIVHTTPDTVRAEADAAVKAAGYDGPYFVDADHIGLKTVDGFLGASDFFTLDVADFIGEKADAASIDAFVEKYRSRIGTLSIPGIDETFDVTEDVLRAGAEKFLLAVQEAGKIYRHICASKGEGAFVTEVSMDETDIPQSPLEMFFILAAVADEGIPAQTIAPRFSGRFNKSVDYVGDPAQFAREFAQDIAVIQYAVKEFGLPENLKLSVHSGSDKFSIYQPIREACAQFDAGVHLKTAGTTWLEELIGLAEAGGDGLTIAREVYRAAHGRFDELCGPYASVIDIDQGALPTPETVESWDGARFASALRHDPARPEFDPNLRQLLHVGYKVAAEMGDRFTKGLTDHADVIAHHVTENLWERHIKPVFIGG